MSSTAGGRWTSDPVALAYSLAEQLPDSDLASLQAATAAGVSGLRRLRAETTGSLRVACDRLLDVLTACSPEFLAGVLAGAARAVAYPAQLCAVDVVWTGPASDVTTSRLTAAVVADLVDGALEEVVLVSFAAHTEQAIGAALLAAVDRGVEVTLLLERAEDNPEYRSSGMPFPGVPARRLTWPAHSRPPGAALHAKILVVDSSLALVGSANLTNRAMEDNLECGVLLRGGSGPDAIRRHLLGLLERGVLVRV